jgi:hypothetical protein
MKINTWSHDYLCSQVTNIDFVWKYLKQHIEAI